MMTRHKGGRPNDGEEVVAELVGFRCFARVVNHEFAVPFGEGESVQSVLVGNHNFFDKSFVNAVQKGCKTGTVPVEAGTNVGDELVVWTLVG